MARLFPLGIILDGAIRLVAIRLAELYPRSQFVGVDLPEEAVTYARTEGTARGLQNVEFVVADLSDFDRTAEPTSFEVVTTFDAVHDQAWPLNLLKDIHRTLKPDGLYLMQDSRDQVMSTRASTTRSGHSCTPFPACIA
jgi:cyclopropane fatty-acyl-phospholipid synthase-like methyltransferase